jgi:MoxR-like ATPase
MTSTPPTHCQPASIDATVAMLAGENYVADRALATALFLSLKLGRPLFLEGEAGVGKTEIARVLSRALAAPLVRLQCYEGLDVAGAVYEWNIQKQMLAIRLAEAGGANTPSLYGRDFLIERPILRALTLSETSPAILLIDELDRADEPFEAFLLEVLAEYQVTIPEWGTVAAKVPPVVIITSNRTREIHDAIKRRCFYHWVDYPSAERELAILRAKAPDAPQRLSQEVVAFVQRLRGIDLFKVPGVAETIDWTRALMALDTIVLDPQTIHNTLGVLLKYQDDIARIQGSEAAALLNEVQARIAASANTSG